MRRRESPRRRRFAAEGRQRRATEVQRSAAEAEALTGGRVADSRPTLVYNGYGEFVAGIYKGLESERLWA